jgi:hypothetical protein
LHDDGSYNVDTYPVVSFSHQGGALSGFNALPANMQALLIPLPPLSSRHPTPTNFGNVIGLIGGFATGRDSRLLVNPERFIVPDDRQVRLIWFFLEFSRIS